MDLDDDDEEEIEYTIMPRKDVNAYQLPPRTSASGYRAEEWKTCIWSGKIWVVAKGKDSIVRLINAATDELFLQSVIENGDHDKFVERTVDSSRYFIVRVVHPQTKKVAFIGFGFEDRNDAFDFNACLSDFKNRNDPKENPIVSGPAKDYSLKEGEKITINIKKKPGKPRPDSTASSASASLSDGFLPPPPVATQCRKNMENSNDTSINPFARGQGGQNEKIEFPAPTAFPTTSTNPFTNSGDDVFANTGTDTKGGTKADPFGGEDPFKDDDDFFGDFQSGT